MKMIAFAVEKEEISVFQNFAGRYGIDVVLSEERPCIENAELTKGMDCINVLSETVLTKEMWNIYHKNGIKIGVTRCVGMEHMNAAYAEGLGIKICNVSYSPASVADYAIMMMLMLLRQVKPILQRYAGQDYTMAGMRGRELPNLTVGIIGAGRIGVTAARHLSGFGCRVLYWNRRPKAEMEGIAKYCDLYSLLAESDIVSLHLISNEDTYHFMNREKLGRMKENSFLINTARGPLVDTQALIEALETEKIAGAGLDVFDGDRSIYNRDHKNQIILHHSMAVLNAMPNVLMLPHAAYFTDQALEDMVHNSLKVSSALFGKKEDSEVLAV